MGGLADPATSGDFHEEERSHLHGIVRKSESTRLAGTWVVPLKARVVVRIYHGRNIINPPLRLIKYDFGNSIEHLKRYSLNESAMPCFANKSGNFGR